VTRAADLKEKELDRVNANRLRILGWQMGSAKKPTARHYRAAMEWLTLSGDGVEFKALEKLYERWGAGIAFAQLLRAGDRRSKQRYRSRRL
jgi:hypothetical protein